SFKPPEWLADPRVIAGLTAAGVFIATLMVLAILSRSSHTTPKHPDEQSSNSSDPKSKLKATPLRPSDAEAGWIRVFNGRDLDGWEPVSAAAEWTVEKGVLVGRGKPGWLSSKAQYENFELALDYRLPKGGNSGVFLRAWPEGGETGARFLEIQLLDDKAPEFKGAKPETFTGSLFEIAAPTAKLDTTPEKWHSLRVKLVGERLEVTHDGTDCLDFNLSQAMSDREALHRKTGRIGLQSYGPECSFRNIRVRRLESDGKSASTLTPRPGWIDLFDGKSLQGWVQRGGSANFRVDNGEIVGTSVPFTPDSYLCTMGGYRDFLLELEFKVDAPLNSGVLVRGQYVEEGKTISLNGVPKYISGNTVYGYQVEIDPANRWATGGIYEEEGRGWLSNPSNNAGESAFKPDQWNRLRVECVGALMRTWVNETLAVEAKDSATPAGFIGLQVHKVPNGQPPREVRFRNIQLKQM
ncbi:MAG TPA: DUF1080 domain-containing protein, partial [Planctomycetaceae bacterium]|nr:DUF1080 domain-containing protein [Planctomycetaceae bacterium]